MKLDLAALNLTDDCPQVEVDWCDAAHYCNWLSQIEGIPKSQWCYEPNAEGKYAQGMKPAKDFVQRTGYRLPTEIEWEYACRSGSQTSRFYGLSVELLPKYAWFLGNSDHRDRIWPVAMKKPNDYGLFDMLGNVWQWCETRTDVWNRERRMATWRFVHRRGVGPAFCLLQLPTRVGDPRQQCWFPRGAGLVREALYCLLHRRPRHAETGRSQSPIRPKGLHFRFKIRKARNSF